MTTTITKLWQKEKVRIWQVGTTTEKNRNAINATHQSKIDCTDTAHNVYTNLFIHHVMGCTGMYKHSTIRSHHCCYHGFKNEQLNRALQKWGPSHGEDWNNLNISGTLLILKNSCSRGYLVHHYFYLPMPLYYFSFV